MKLAIYDLDGTLYKKDTFKLFWKFLLKNRYFSPAVFISSLLNYLLFLLGIRELRDFKESVCSALKDKGKIQIENIIDDFISGINPDNYREELIHNISLEKENGYLLVMLTASPDIYANIIGKKLSFDVVLATETEFNKNIFTGRISGKNLAGEEKVKVLMNKFNLDKDTLARSRGYGNRDDLPWLSLLGHKRIY